MSRHDSSNRTAFAGAAWSTLLLGSPLLALADQPAVPAALRAEGETVVLTVHAQGAQVYQCETDPAGKLKWQFREPIATLFQDGKTIGRHYAGPNWELSDGSSVQGKVTAKADGAAPSDIPWLKLTAASHKGQGLLADVTTIQRLNTHGGGLVGDCEGAGGFRSVAYSAEYVFLRK